MPVAALATPAPGSQAYALLGADLDREGTLAAAAALEAASPPLPPSFLDDGDGDDDDDDDDDDDNDAGQGDAAIAALLQGHGLGATPTTTFDRDQALHFQKPRFTPRPTNVPQVVQHALLRRDETFTQANATELPTSATDISGQPSATTSAISHQNLLAIMPTFAFSMPAQTVVAGVNIALVTVLAVHLLFTVQYHFPLSRSNYCLQISSTIILLINLCVHLHVILKDLAKQSHQWPFMFPYLAEGLPPGDGSWTLTQDAFFLLMRAVTTVSIHLTHIQFLTLLFPSALEARLILWMLGPLALAAAGMEFTWLSPEDDVKTSDLGDAIRNICNSTLTLLYTCALLIWGGLVNRRRAWRSDGGTAAFGGGSMGLATMNTVMSFVQIRFDRLWWLPDICWTLTIWQSWLGFWWWVGAGMGIGEVEDRAEREARRKRRREKLRRKLEKEERQRQKAQDAAAAAGGTEEGSDVLTGIRRIRDRITGDSSQKDYAAGGGGAGPSGTLSRRLRRMANGAGEPGQAADEIELREVRASEPPLEDEGGGGAFTESDGAYGRRGRPGMDGAAGPAGADLTGISVADGSAADDARTTAGSGSSDTNPTSSAQSGPRGWLTRVEDIVDAYQPAFIKRRMRRLRVAHAAAAKRAATEQTILRNQVLSANRTPGLRAMMFDRDDAGAAGAGPSSSRRASRNGPGGGAGGASGSRRASVAAAAQQQGGMGSTQAAGLGLSVAPEEAETPGLSPAPSGAHSLPYDRSYRHADSSTLFSNPFRSDDSAAGGGGGGGSTAEVDRSSMDARHSLDRDPDEDEEWVADDRDGGQADAGAANVSPAAADAGSEAGDGAAAADDGQGAAQGRGGGRSWFWQGGLERARLRDRQTYD